MENLIVGSSKGRRCTDTNVVRNLYVNRRRNTTFDKFKKTRNCHKCPVMGCNFWTCTPGLIDVHMCEEHRTVNGTETSQVSVLTADFKDNVELTGTSVSFFYSFFLTKNVDLKAVLVGKSCVLVKVQDDVRVVVTSREDVARTSGVVDVVDTQNTEADLDSCNDEVINAAANL